MATRTRTKTMKETDKPITFKTAAEMVKAALKGTAYENAALEEYGGGDGAEDIKPFRLATKNGVDFGATVYPEGGLLFWVWDDRPDSMNEHKTASEAIAEFHKIC